MEGNTVILAENLMKFMAIVIVSGIIFGKLSKKILIPDVVLFIIAGVIIGPSVLNWVDFSQYSVINQIILSFGAAYILFDGGREISFNILNKIKMSVSLLATIGVLISTFITAFFACKILHIDFIYAILLGSIIASTDPSVLVPLFKNMKISDKLKQTIIAESAFNDAAGAIITFAIVAIISGGTFSFATSILELLKTALGGIMVGLIFGYIAVLLISEHKFGLLREQIGEISIAAVLGAYVTAQYFGFSGFMSVFIVGMIEGNKSTFGFKIQEEYYDIYLKFKDTIISLIRIMIFVILGIQINFKVLSEHLGEAIILVMLFIFIARPLSVLFSVIFDKKAAWKFSEIVYLMWTRETGVIPAALAGMLISMKVQHSDIIAAVTTTAIIITLTLQASSAEYFAKILKLQMDN
jgi:NhaP-type Na+/H+ or K+/H+ antiporter